MKIELTDKQRGITEHRIKMGMIASLRKQGIIEQNVFMEASRIQREKDREFIHPEAFEVVHN